MDYSRQLGLFDPQDIKQKSVCVIGAGATGSHVILQLAMMGWGNSPHGQGSMIVYDGDKVEEHNLSNQVFESKHIGIPKVEAIKEIVMRKCGFEINVRNEMVEDQADVRCTYVFLLTDTMKSRKQIFDNCLQHSFYTDLVIETRMDIDNGRVYSINPNNPIEVEKWKKTLYSDEESAVSACGASASIIPTVFFLSGLAVWRLVHHFDVNYGKNYTEKKVKQSKPFNETLFSLGPEVFMTRSF